jgi:hypothetical protein
MLAGIPIPFSFLVLAAAIVLWAVGLAVPLNETNRFRALALAVLLSTLVLVNWLGAKYGLAIAGLTIWTAALVRGIVSPPRVVEEPVAHGSSHH